jgi:hypothetical protein
MADTRPPKQVATQLLAGRVVGHNSCLAALGTICSKELSRIGFIVCRMVD